MVPRDITLLLRSLNVFMPLGFGAIDMHRHGRGFSYAAPSKEVVSSPISSGFRSHEFHPSGRLDAVVVKMGV